MEPTRNKERWRCWHPFHALDSFGGFTVRPNFANDQNNDSNDGPKGDRSVPGGQPDTPTSSGTPVQELPTT